jgi:hypothetical protein
MPYVRLFKVRLTKTPFFLMRRSGGRMTARKSTVAGFSGKPCYMRLICLELRRAWAVSAVRLCALTRTRASIGTSRPAITFSLSHLGSGLRARTQLFAVRGMHPFTMPPGGKDCQSYGFYFIHYKFNDFCHVSEQFAVYVRLVYNWVYTG